MDSIRNQIFNYAKEKYNTIPEYLWRRFPDYAVLRHSNNKKWYGLIMYVQRERLGLDGDGLIDILNVKLRDPLFVDMLLQQEGYLSGYHISRSNWISVLLDGSVPLEDICGLLDESFNVTASKQRKQKDRPPKEWIIPANPKYYDIGHAFDNTEEIDWKQGRGIKAGDIVFMYVAAPVSAILYKCKVIETDIPYKYNDMKLSIKALMKIRLLKRYDSDAFTFERLKNDYEIFAVRGPREVPYSLSEALKK